MQVTVYDSTTGAVIRSLDVFNPDDAPLQVGAGESWLEGASDPKLHKVVSGAIVDLTEAEKQALADPFTVEDVIAERKRRLALGFDYDFEDERGVHNFATTEKDMEGWREVSMWAEAEAGLGNTGATQSILTETGAVTVSVSEWFLILRAATAFRQPIWQASFALQALDPIPDPTTWAGWP